MALSAGTRALLREAASWTALAAVLAIATAHYTELRDFAVDALVRPPEAAVSAGSADSTRAPHHDPGRVELHADARGHFNSEVEINGRTITAMVDTGATMVALSYEDAERSGIRLSSSDFTHHVRTANGVARVAPVTLDRVRIGSIEVRNVPATVSEPRRLDGTLLGMTFLGRLSRLEMRSGTLILHD